MMCDWLAAPLFPRYLGAREFHFHKVGIEE